MSAGVAAPGVVEKTEFKNRSSGHLGVVVLDRDGREKGANIEPGGTIFLSDDEIQLTANAPQKAEDNPFLVKHHVIHDQGTGELIEEGDWPALELVAEKRPVPLGQMSGAQRPTPATGQQAPANGLTPREQQIASMGGAVAPQGQPPQGSYQPGEEVGDPTAPAQTPPPEA
jgi:hypothetical protein